MTLVLLNAFISLSHVEQRLDLSSDHSLTLVAKNPPGVVKVEKPVTLTNKKNRLGIVSS